MSVNLTFKEACRHSDLDNENWLDKHFTVSQRFLFIVKT